MTRAKLLSIAASCMLVLLLVLQDSLAASVVTSRRPKANHGQNCTNHLQIIDRCSSMATYSYSTSFNPYPMDLDSMKTSCDRIQEGLKCLKTHGKCMSSVARRSLNSFTVSRSKHSKRLCTNLADPKTTEFVKSAECISKFNKQNLMVSSEKDLISSIQFLAANTTMKWEQRFHSACCAALAYKTKAMKDIEPECLKYKESHEDMVNSMVGELLESACPEASRLNEICSKLPKLTLVKEWKSGSLTGAALNLIVALSDTSKDEQ